MHSMPSADFDTLPPGTGDSSNNVHDQQTNNKALVPNVSIPPAKRQQYEQSNEETDCDSILSIDEVSQFMSIHVDSTKQQMNVNHVYTTQLLRSIQNLENTVNDLSKKMKQKDDLIQQLRDGGVNDATKDRENTPSNQNDSVSIF
jgi:hypothetical protein